MGYIELGREEEEEEEQWVSLETLSDDTLLVITEYLCFEEVYSTFSTLCRRTRSLILQNPRIIAHEEEGITLRQEILRALLESRIEEHALDTLCEVSVENAYTIDDEFANRFFFGEHGPLFGRLNRLTIKNSRISHVKLSVETCVLEYLDLSNSKQLKQLEIVDHTNVEQSDDLSDHGKCTASSVPLKTLILDGCEVVFLGFESASRMAHLEHVSFARARWLDDSELEAYLQYWPHIRKINLRACRGVGDIAMNFISEHLKELEVLILDNTNVGNHGIQVLTDAKMEYSSTCSPLRELSLSGCRLSNKSIDSLSRLQKLESLSLCKQNVNLLEPLVNMHFIRHLNLAFVHINDEQLEGVTKTLGFLRSLNLSFCKFITDDSMQHIANNCSQIRWLDVSSARRISNVGLRHLTDSAVLSLMYLNVSYCSPAMNQAAVDSLKKAWPQCVVKFIAS